MVDARIKTTTNRTMPKIDVETAKFILQRNIPDIRKVQEIMQDIQQELQADEEERANRPPAIKKQFAIVLSDNDGSLAGKDIVGWVVQLPEEDSVAVAPSRIALAAYAHNATLKGRRLPVQTIGEACEVVTAKLFKEHNVWVKTRVPVLAVAQPNAIPTEKSE